jgi:hypothetical protein
MKVVICKRAKVKKYVMKLINCLMMVKKLIDLPLILEERFLEKILLNVDTLVNNNAKLIYARKGESVDFSTGIKK